MKIVTSKLITGAMGVMLLSTPLAQATAFSCPDWACGTNGPSLDGQRVVPRPDRTAVVQEAQAITLNGPSLDGRRIDLRGHAAR